MPLFKANLQGAESVDIPQLAIKEAPKALSATVAEDP